METLFSVGADIEINIKGHVVEYTMRESAGDCYTIEFDDGLDRMDGSRKLRVYLSTKDLLMAGAKEVNSAEK